MASRAADAALDGTDGNAADAGCLFIGEAGSADEHQGFALRQPAVAPRGQARDFSDIATDLAARTGLTARYVAAINKGAAGVLLKNAHADFSLPTDRVPELDVIWDAVCRAASAEVTDGREIPVPDGRGELQDRPVGRSDYSAWAPRD